MADNNIFLLTQFTSKTLGTFVKQRCPMLATSYRGVEEFNDHAGYGVSDIVNIKKPGYPTLQLGVATTAEAIIDAVQPYTVADTDIYNTSYDVNIRKIKMQVVGGRVAFSGDPNFNPDNAKEINPQAKTMIDNYIYPSAVTIKGGIETSLATKAKNAAFYTPIDTPAKLGSINSYASISSVEALMEELGFITSRYGMMNTTDSKLVADSLQNMFNETINKDITREARLGGPDKGRLASIDIYRSNVIPIQEEAPQFAVSPTFTVSSVAANGSTITFTGVDAVATVIFNAGSKIAIPSVRLINQVTKKVLETSLVITVAEDAIGDGAGNVLVTLSEPLVAVGMQANVDSLPAAAAPAELFPAHRNNFFYVPMGIIANPIGLGDIVGADNSRYVLRGANVDITCYIQGVVNEGVNTYRMACLCPTLAFPRYLIHLPSAL
jgi:hypothetical protein